MKNIDKMAKTILILSIFLLAPSVSYGIDPVPNTFAPGDTVSSSEMNANFDYVTDAITTNSGVKLMSGTQEVGVLLDMFYHPEPGFLILNEKNFIVRISSAQLYLVRPHFSTDNCTGQAYILSADLQDLKTYQSGNTLPHGSVFRSYWPEWNSVYYAPQGVTEEQVVIISQACLDGLDIACCEVPNPYFPNVYPSAVWQVMPNDPIITGEESWSYFQILTLTR